MDARLRGFFCPKKIEHGPSRGILERCIQRQCQALRKRFAGRYPAAPAPGVFLLYFFVSSRPGVLVRENILIN